MFAGCVNLTDFNASLKKFVGWNSYNIFDGCKLNSASVNNIIQSLKTENTYSYHDRDLVLFVDKETYFNQTLQNTVNTDITTHGGGAISCFLTTQECSFEELQAACNYVKCCNNMF